MPGTKPVRMHCSKHTHILSCFSIKYKLCYAKHPKVHFEFIQKNSTEVQEELLAGNVKKTAYLPKIAKNFINIAKKTAKDK